MLLPVRRRRRARSAAARRVSGEKIATVALTGPNLVGEATFTSTKPVVRWSEWDAVRKGRKNMDFPITYEVDVLQGGALVGTVSCDTGGSSQGTCKPGGRHGPPRRRARSHGGRRWQDGRIALSQLQGGRE